MASDVSKTSEMRRNISAIISGYLVDTCFVWIVCLRQTIRRIHSAGQGNPAIHQIVDPNDKL